MWQRGLVKSIKLTLEGNATCRLHRVILNKFIGESDPKRLNTQSAGPVRLLILSSVSIFLLASLVVLGQLSTYLASWV
jgi:hypothetical protein